MFMKKCIASEVFLFLFFVGVLYTYIHTHVYLNDGQNNINSNGFNIKDHQSLKK